MNRESLNRSLVRLGKAGADSKIPAVFIEFELELAIRRFGTMRVLRRLFISWWRGL
jgi:hypothetical protein